MYFFYFGGGGGGGGGGGEQLNLYFLPLGVIKFVLSTCKSKPCFITLIWTAVYMK